MKHFDLHAALELLANRKMRISFECQECGNQVWHEAYSRDDFCRITCKNCNCKTTHARHELEFVNWDKR